MVGRCMRALALAAVVVSMAAAFDCDRLEEPERTHCLDRAADQKIGMVPVQDEDIVGAQDNDDEPVDDVMGDLGESSKTSVKMSAKAQMKQDLKLAQAETAGMYDSDIMVAKAFSDLDDSMDDLSFHLDGLKAGMRIADSENQVRKEFHQEEVKRAQRETELGESESTDAPAEQHDDMGVLGASAADLDKDLTVEFHAPKKEVNTEQRVDELMGQLRSISGKKKVKDVRMLDDSVEFVEFSSGDIADDGATSDMVIQDLQSSDDSLVSRAKMEASQSMNMDDNDADVKSQADELDAAEKEEAEASSGLDDLDKVYAETRDDEGLGESGDDDALIKKEAMEAKMVVDEDEDGKVPKKMKAEHKDIGDLAQTTAVTGAANFANEEDEKEEDEIKKAQAREKKMEEDAKKHMYSQMKQMNDDVKNQQDKLEQRIKVHKKEEAEADKSLVPEPKAKPEEKKNYKHSSDSSDEVGEDDDDEDDESADDDADDDADDEDDEDDSADSRK